MILYIINDNIFILIYVLGNPRIQRADLEGEGGQQHPIHIGNCRPIILNKYRGVYSSPRNETYYKYISGWEQGRSGWKQAGSAGHRKWQSCWVECEIFFFIFPVLKHLFQVLYFSQLFNWQFVAGALRRNLCKDQRECWQGLLWSDERNQVREIIHK